MKRLSIFPTPRKNINKMRSSNSIINDIDQYFKTNKLMVVLLEDNKVLFEALPFTWPIIKSDQQHAIHLSEAGILICLKNEDKTSCIHRKLTVKQMKIHKGLDTIKYCR